MFPRCPGFRQSAENSLEVGLAGSGPGVWVSVCGPPGHRAGGSAGRVSCFPGDRPQPQVFTGLTDGMTPL